MTHFAETARPARRLAERAFATFAAGWERMRAEHDTRVAIEQLSRLDDHMLQDIGLRRDDIAAGVRGRARRR